MQKNKWALLIALLLLVSSPLYGAGDPKKEILYRKNVMRAVGAHMTGIGRILKGEVSHKHLVQQAEALNLSAQLARDVFPPGTDTGKTGVKPNIWTEPEKFAKAVKDFEDATSKFAELAASGDMAAIGAQMKTLGKTCKSCHKDFRKKKKRK